MTSPRALWLVSLGRMPYLDALAFQREVAKARITGAVPQDVLLLVEHPPVVTLGRSTKAQHVTTSPELLAERGVEVHEVERGGDVTFHGPGQLVGYPVMDLQRHRQDLHWYLRQVEESLMLGLATLGLPTERSAGYTGVWTRGVGDAHPARKLASIGVHARAWVTWHGFALNVNTDLSWFDLIVPCGIAGVEMTSVARELARAHVAMGEVEEAVAGGFARAFDLTAHVVAAASLELEAPEPAAAAIP